MQATNQTKAGTAKTQAVEFKCHAPDAQLVFVAGTFNEWKPDVSPLARDKTGTGELRSSFPRAAMNSNSWWMAAGAATPRAWTNNTAAPIVARILSAQ